MIQENEIRARLLSLSDLGEFEDWLAQQSWNMHQDSDPSAQRLVGKIELALAEFHNGDINEASLFQMLRNLARTYEIRFSDPSDIQGESVSYSSNSLAQTPHVEMPDEVVFAS